MELNPLWNRETDPTERQDRKLCKECIYFEVKDGVYHCYKHKHWLTNPDQSNNDNAMQIDLPSVKGRCDWVYRLKKKE